jgi:hypothetical protein
VVLNAVYENARFQARFVQDVACIWDDGIVNKGKSHVASSDQKEI